MSKLIVSEFCRHFHNKFLWLCGLLLLLTGVSSGMLINYYETFDDIYIIPMPIIISAYISAETGTEFHNRTLHNKIICGYKRTQIYLTYIITGLVIGSVMLVIFMLPVFIICRSFFAAITLSVWRKVVLIYWLLCLVWTVFGIFSVVISSSKLIGCILSLTIIFGLYAGAYELGALAFQPEFSEEICVDSVEMTPEEIRQVKEGRFEGSYSWTETENGSVIYYKEILVGNKIIPNPYYIPKPYSTILKQIVCLMPQGQINLLSSYLISALDSPNDETGVYNYINRFPLYSSADIVFFCSLGFFIFRKKDLK